MVRRLVEKLVTRAFQSPDDWEKVLEDTLLSMGCNVTSVDSTHKLRMMQSAPLEAADLKHDRDYWREEAFKNAREANKAERRARAWKAAAKTAQRAYKALKDVEV